MVASLNWASFSSAPVNSFHLIVAQSGRRAATPSQPPAHDVVPPKAPAAGACGVGLHVDRALVEGGGGQLRALEPDPAESHAREIRRIQSQPRNPDVRQSGRSGKIIGRRPGLEGCEPRQIVGLGLAQGDFLDLPNPGFALQRQGIELPDEDPATHCDHPERAQRRCIGCCAFFAVLVFGLLARFDELRRSGSFCANGRACTRASPVSR